MLRLFKNFIVLSLETLSVQLFCKYGINLYLQPLNHLTNQLINQSTISEIGSITQYILLHKMHIPAFSGTKGLWMIKGACRTGKPLIFSGARGENRTRTDARSTGFWIQRVYQFHHSGGVLAIYLIWKKLSTELSWYLISDIWYQITEIRCQKADFGIGKSECGRWKKSKNTFLRHSIFCGSLFPNLETRTPCAILILIVVLQLSALSLELRAIPSRHS